jgi:poly-gamma-glutamate synthesis protein (capsule biosynthesis protein)
MIIVLSGMAHADLAAARGKRWYVIVEPFYSVRDSMTWDEVQALWHTGSGLGMSAATFTDIRNALGNGLYRVNLIDDPLKWISAKRDRVAIIPFEELSPRFKVIQIEGADIFRHDQANAYPLAVDSDAPNYDPDHLTLVALSGVTALTRETGAMIDEKGAAWAAQDIAPVFAAADIRHTSNEVSFAEECPRKGDVQTFGSLCAKDSYLDVIKAVGFNVIELTGNHNNDYGYDPFLRTLKIYQENGIKTFAGGANQTDAQQPLLIDDHGNTIAFIGCNSAGPVFAWATATTPGAARCDDAWLTKTLSQTKADVKIMSVQYTEYDQLWPVTAHRENFMRLAELGADVVIGTQSHQPQTFMLYGDKFIHFGLGNLFFDQLEIQQKKFFIDRLAVYNGNVINVTLLTGQIEDAARPRLMTEAERTKFLSTMLYLSQTTNKPYESPTR